MKPLAKYLYVLLSFFLLGWLIYTSGLTSAVGAKIPTVGVCSTLPAARLTELGATITIPDYNCPNLRSVFAQLKH